MIKNVYDILSHNIQQKKNQIAFLSEDCEITYEQLCCDIDEMCIYLSDKNIKKGSVIGIQLPNNYFFIKLFWSLQKLGCVVVLINNDNWEQNVNHIVNDVELEYVFTDSICKKKYYSKLDVNVIVTDEIKIDHINLNLINYDLIDSNEAISEDVALIIYTSGSTGQSKGVILTHNNIIQGTLITVDYLKITSRDCIWGMLPFTFDYGLNQLLSSVLVGARLFFKYPFSFFEIPEILNEKKITGLAGVPSVWINLFCLPFINKYNYENLRYITNSGGAIPDKYLLKLKDTFAYTDIYLMYGLTECFRCSYLTPEKFMDKLGSIGKAMPNSEIILLNDDNKLCQIGEVGQIVFRGPTVAKGYLKNENKTSQVYKCNPINTVYSEKVVYSGDYAYMDEDGYLFYVGRKDKQLKKNGFRFNINNLENQIYSLDLVLECCAISKKNNFSEDDVYLFLRKKDNMTEDEVLKVLYCNCINKLPNYMKPMQIFFVDELPKEYNSKYSYKKMGNLLDKLLEEKNNK